MYVELYKKYRPRTFEDVIGQDNVVEPLKQSLANGKVPTGFLFSGGAGTGKTSVALILAKALNCEKPDENHNPCNQCATCKAIDNSTQLGVKYVSMANNGGVDEVRQIMEESRLNQPVNRKVFILDEVHNMSSAAQDSMLIELENDSQKTLFICCTTDPDKVKPAILSRLQQRRFMPVDSKLLAVNLLNICKSEPDIKALLDNGTITKQGLIECAVSAKGSVRTSITNLETLISNGKLPTESSMSILKAILTGDVKEVYKATDEATKNGADYNKTTEQLYNNIVDMYKYKAGVQLKNAEIIKLSDSVSTRLLNYFIKEIGETFKLVSNKVIDYKILYEVCYTNMTLAMKKYKDG